MATVEEALRSEWNIQSETNPFGEAPATVASEDVIRSPSPLGFTPWSEDYTPFSEVIGEGPPQESEQDRLIEEALEQFRDETFDEAVAYLTEETEQAVAERFTDESPSHSAERERFADAHLSPVRFEAQEYLTRFESGLAGLDVASLNEKQLDEVLDRLDPAAGELTPAGEEFIGALARKAKKAVKFVAKAAKSVGKIAGSLLGPLLKKLRALVNPLLRRVLSFAIGRLPAALQPAARKLAARITSEAEDFEELDGVERTQSHLSDVQSLVESFDAALAETVGNPAAIGEEEEAGVTHEDEWAAESLELETLANARGQLIDQLAHARDEEDLTPAIEQFVPALLGALRLGINLVGRPKVVGFLAKFLAKAIQKWVGPGIARPLSNAIVDTGLRLVTLESPSEAEALTRDNEAAPVALASVIEDAARRFAENEEYVFEDEALTHIATAEAFNHAVATHFPARFVRPALQQAPSLGGAFISRRPRSIRTYRKYSRVPEIEVTSQMVDALPSFGHSTVGAALRAAGASLPIRARMHIYQAAPGTTLSRMVQRDRPRGYVPTSNVFPLTPHAAGVLLKEPSLGVAVPGAFLRSPQRITPGQRFYILEPTGIASMPNATATRGAAARTAPSRSWMRLDLRRSRLTIGLYFSESDAQDVASRLRSGQGAMALTHALIEAFRRLNRRSAAAPAMREDAEELFEEFAPLRMRIAAGALRQLQRRVRRWVLTALAGWARSNGEAFARAAGHPDAGVTVHVRLTGLPDVNALLRTGAAISAMRSPAHALRGAPEIAITVTPGSRRG